MAIHCVIFDLDGTLLDTSEGVLAAACYTMDEMGLARPDAATLATFIGPPIQDSFAKAYGLEGPILQEIATTFRNRYKDTDLFKARTYDGIVEVLQKLHAAGLKLAVATYKREDYAIDLLKEFRLAECFDVIHGADHFNKLKKADIVAMCLQETGVENPEEAILVGDTVHDAIGAQKQGVHFIAVTYGYGFKSQEDTKQNPCYGIAKNPEEIGDIILCTRKS